jgi:hypothetical protein
MKKYILYLLYGFIALFLADAMVFLLMGVNFLYTPDGGIMLVRVILTIPMGIAAGVIYETIHK